MNQKKRNSLPPRPPICKKEPIAIIGMSCRFPGGASNPERFWEKLCQGFDAIVDIPIDRWDKRKFFDVDREMPGKTYMQQGGFLEESIHKFDPLFFGISPREAEALDPQQRLLLEVSWEAFENAGYQTEQLSGSKTGVFIGGFTLDNKILRFNLNNRDLISSFSAPTSAMTLLANRLSYFYNLMGPSFTIDTACSGSLVSVHQACMSIRNNESQMALVGGVNVMLGPEYPIAMSKGQFLSPHCRCKAFDKDAQGYVRGEGCGVVILKSYSQAIEDKDSILALILDSGINHDGHTAGIALPNPVAQQALIEEVYDRAEIDASDVEYIEAHGTGTQAGDFAELTALNRVLSKGRQPENKCLVGSVKTNIGHLEAAAGIASLIKTTLCLKNGSIPPNLHFKNPNPKINFDEICLKVPTGIEPINSINKPVIAGINSFGFGGANAHVLIQSVPQTEQKFFPQAETNSGPMFIPLSAKSEPALINFSELVVENLVNEQAGKKVSLEDLQYTLCKRKSHHNFRLGMVINSKEELVQNLKEYAINSYFEGLIKNRSETDLKSGPVFVYTGMGPQWWRMGRELMEQEPVFKNSVIECDAIFKEISGWSIQEALQSDEESSRMSETQVAQPANFVIQVALTSLLEKWGIYPVAIVGHSVGEISAAYISGALSLKDSLRVVYHRSRLQQTTAGQGTMLAVQLPVSEIETIIEPFEKISLAAINSPNFVTLAGIESSLKTVSKQLDERGVFNRFLRVEVAYHSYQMDPLEQEFKESLASLSPGSPKYPLYSTVTGEKVTESLLDNEYWWKNMRQPVRFAKAISTMIDDDCSRFMEIGPHPVLASAIKECLSEAEQKGAVFSTLDRKKPERESILTTIGELHCHGFAIDWDYHLNPNAGFVQLPNYPWDRERYWLDSERSIEERIGLLDNHPFLNINSRLPYPAWEVELCEALFPYLPDHKIQEKIIFPGAAYVESGLALQAELNKKERCLLKDIRFHRFLQLSETHSQKLHLSFNPELNVFSVHSSYMSDEKDWKLHASGEIIDIDPKQTAPLELDKLLEKFSTEMSAPDLYSKLDQRGLTYGPHFQGIKRLWQVADEILLEYAGNMEKGDSERYLLHPAILDSCFQGVAPLVMNTESPFVPIGIKHLRFFNSPGQSCFCHLTLVERSEKKFSVNLLLFDKNGSVLVEIEKATFELLPKISSESPVENLFYKLEWMEDLPPKSTEKDAIENEGWLFLSSAGKRRENIHSYFTANELGFIELQEGIDFQQQQANQFAINPQSADEYEQFFSTIKDFKVKNILYAWELGSHPFAPSKETFFSYADRCQKLMYLVQAIMKHRPYQKMTLNLLISGVSEGKETPAVLAPNPELNALSALGLPIENEYPYLNCKAIQIPEQAEDFPFERILNEILQHPDDKQVMLTDESRYSKRLIRKLQAEEDGEIKTQKRKSDEPLNLEIQNPGMFESLVYREIKRRSPGPGEVEVKIQAAGLNFKDLLKVLGHLSSNVTDNTYFGDAFGMESAGIVERVGEGVSEFKKGNPVYTLSKHICTYTTLNAMAVFHKPKTLSLIDTPVIIPFLTAYYGLVTCARLEPGEKILIHNAAGATGMAAVIVALSLKAEIFATAGSEIKRNYLKSMGIKYIMDSRSLNFYEDVLKTTDGKGVDVVLNALPGEVQRKSFELLASFGRFVEIGKRDIAENNLLPMQTFNRNTSFIAVDIDRMIIERPEYLKSLMKTVMEKIDSDEYSPLPIHHFPADKTVDAFRFFSQSKQIGKIVIDFSDCEVEAIPAASKDQLYNSDATCIVTGGTRGFGLEVAKWLSTKDVRQLVLLSKSGSVDEKAQQDIVEMEQSGTKVETVALDIGDAEGVSALFKQIRSSMPPLKGIFHGAMVLDDAFIPDLNSERMNKVLEPKVAGVINLHLNSLDDPIQHFVLFSSISAIIGNAGQGNYIAANAFLDAFADFRKHAGLPALSVNWGAIAETGVITQNERLKQVMEESGIIGLSNRIILQILDKIISESEGQLGAFDIDWKQWSLMNPKGAKASFFQQVTQAGNLNTKTNKENAEILDKLKDLEKSNQIEFCAALIKDQLSGLINLPSSRIDSRQKINELGIDSLMTVEMINIFRTKFGVEFSTFDLLDGPTIEHLSGLFLQKLMDD